MDEILKKYEVRKSNKEKTEFIGYMKKRLSNIGYEVNIEEVTFSEFYGTDKCISFYSFPDSNNGTYICNGYSSSDWFCFAYE